MSYPLVLTQSQILTALRSVLLTILPAGIEVIQGEQNRIAEPQGADFVVMTPILRKRLEFGNDSSADCAFTASITGTVLTVSAMILGTINVAATPTLFGPNVAPGTQITAQTGGTPGGAGAYTVSVPQTISSEEMAAGLLNLLQPTELTVQCDVHGPGSADNCQRISTVLRSAYGCDLFTALRSDVQTLYAGEPRQSPFVNAEQQVEIMWSVDAVLQANQIVEVPQQYAQTATVTVVTPPVDAFPH